MAPRRDSAFVTARYSVTALTSVPGSQGAQPGWTLRRSDAARSGSRPGRDCPQKYNKIKNKKYRSKKPNAGDKMGP